VSDITGLAQRTPLTDNPSSCREDTGHTICYLSSLAASIPGPLGEQMDREAGGEGLGGGTPYGSTGEKDSEGVCGLSHSSLTFPASHNLWPRPDMRCWWQIFVFWVFWMLILWLVAPRLDLTPEPAPQEDLMYLVIRHCSCPWFKFRKYVCSSGTLNCSSCYHTAGGLNYDRTVETLRGTKESVVPDAVLWWLGLNSESKLRKVWKLLLTVIPRPSGSHFDLYCKTCVVMGSSQILWGTGHSINQYTKVFRMNQAPVQDFETDVSNRTTGCFIYPKNAGDQGDRSWLVLLLLKLSNLAWTLDIQSEEVVVWELRNS
uniref:beta-D-galactosyl-(1->3)-N-acetyl-beta-D-galactosaminide alpha-2,3-sialyltransferase n=1 Tax=Loxodonta africana TaxID=9785 RepID=G3T6F9_LOXAF